MSITPFNSVGPEHKFVDSPCTGGGWGITWTQYPLENLLGVAQGDGESERDGRVYWITEITGHLTVCLPLLNNSTFPANPFQGRYIVFVDHQTNGTEYVTDDVINEVEFCELESFYNLHNEDRFTILEDETIYFESQMVQHAVEEFANAGALFSIVINHVFDPPMRVTCSGTSANISDVVDNSIHMMYVRDNNTPVHSTTALWRMRFFG